MKIIIAGGRTFKDKQHMKDALYKLYQQGIVDKATQLICGMAKGADMMGKELFDEYGLGIPQRILCIDDSNGYN